MQTTPSAGADIRALAADRMLWPVVLQMLMGAVDATASRRLNLSPRTYCRRVAEVLDLLGVDTRFQAGVEIGRLTGIAMADVDQVCSLKKLSSSWFTASGLSMKPK